MCRRRASDIYEQPVTFDGQNPSFELLRECTILSRRWRSFYDARIKRFGLTAAKASAVYWLADAGRPMKQVELAYVLQVEGATLVRLLHSLEAEGIVERKSIEGDARAKSVCLTPKGLSLVELITVENASLSQEALETMSAIKIQKAVTLIKEARRALTAAENESRRAALAGERSARRN